VLAGTVDVLVCDSLTGNAIVKMLAAWETGGSVEVAGSGYGPGVGDGAAMVGIISRATGAPVVANAMALMAKMVRSGLAGIHAEELARARAAGFGGAARPVASAAARKPVHHEIGGVDVLQIDAVVALLAARGIYAEPAMGCTGPVVLVADEDAGAAGAALAAAGLL
jgi:betaine reductase